MYTARKIQPIWRAMLSSFKRFTAIERNTVIWVLILLLMHGSATHLLRSTIKFDQTHSILIAAIIFILCLIFKIGKKSSFEALNNSRRYVPLSIIPVLLLAVWAGCRKAFGSFDIGAILFHLSHDLTYEGLTDDTIKFCWFIFFGFVLVGCIFYLARRDRRVAFIEKIFAITILLVNPLTVFTYDRLLNPNRNALNLVEVYNPVELSSLPTQKKNLILIYLESLEATFERPVFGRAFEDLGILSKEGLRINGITEAQDTGWTTAGMTATQCGVPLLSYGIVRKNKMKKLESFLPNADCLASRLSDYGYETRYYGGADLNFAAKGAFLTTHGYQRVVGLDEIPEDQRGALNKWGVYDDRVFDLAYAELQDLSASESPFLLSILTIGPHSPAGFPAKTCYDMIENADMMDTMLLAVTCTAKLTRNFLEKAEAEGLLENTAIVLMSDHLSHKNTQTRLLNKYERENFILILDGENTTGSLDKPGTMLDIYPTLLETIGFSPENSSAGLGVSLFGETPSLIEQYGRKTLDLAIRSDKTLREMLWNINQGPSSLALKESSSNTDFNRVTPRLSAISPE